VYPALAQLEDEDLVRAEQLGERRVFALTDAGRAWVDERPDASEPPWEQMTDADDDGVGALFGEMRRIGMAVGQIGHVGTAREVDGAREILAKARRAVYALLSEDETTNERKE
jgi:DNA-binding PadR family transcriptional regulator